MNDDNSDEKVLVVGGGREVSVQVVQDVYNSLTGQTEAIHRVFHDSQIVDFDALQHLHSKLEHTIEQYDCAASNLTITVRYCDGKSEKYSSFARFKAQGGTRKHVVEEVVFDYDFLIKLPKTREAKPYNFEIGIRSTLGVIEGLKKRGGREFSETYFFRYDNASARMGIHYVDLAVARTLEAQFEEWFQELNRIKNPWLLKVSRKGRETTQVLLRVLALVVCAYLLLQGFAAEIQNEADLFRFGLFSFVALSFTQMVSLRASFLVDRWMERLRPYSVVRLTAADTDAEKNWTGNLLRAWAKTIIAALASIILGLLSAAIATRLGL